MTSDPKRPERRMFVRCTVVSKPEVGEIHIHRRPWRPSHVFEMTYTAPGGGEWVVPEGQWEQMMTVDSHLAAMALLRS